MKSFTYKKLFLEISQNSQENICARVSFLIKFQPLGLLINSIIKQYCSCCIILIRINTILSKDIQNNSQNFFFRTLLAQSGDQTDIFWIFTCLQTRFGCPKPWGECQVTPLRKPDDCFCIFHSSFFIDFCHPLN